MPDKPIRFSAPMLPALLNGRKIQDRRILPQHFDIGQNDTLQSYVKVKYAIGDRLWVQEAHKLIDRHCDYRADWPEATQHLFRWRPSVHMHRWASRLTLTVTDVRVQRLKEISTSDTISEGVQCETCEAMSASACNRQGCFASRYAFCALWETIHGPDAWDANPWVVALTFAVHRCNIDKMPHGGAQ